jgi:hypothetical protein
MRKRNLLFVTYHGARFDDGLSYALHLAKTLDKDISVLLVQEKKGMMVRISDMIAASAFAEAHEPTVAIEIMNEGSVTEKEVEKEKSQILAKCRMEGVGAVVKTSAMELVQAVRESVKGSTDVEMVLLGPTVTADGGVTARQLDKLVKTATRPVITIARQTHAA